MKETLRMIPQDRARCWDCDAEYNIAVAITPRLSPKPGHLGVCEKCEAISVYDENSRPRKPHANELTTLIEHTEECDCAPPRVRTLLLQTLNRIKIGE